MFFQRTLFSFQIIKKIIIYFINIYRFTRNVLYSVAIIMVRCIYPINSENSRVFVLQCKCYRTKISIIEIRVQGCITQIPIPR